MSLYPGGLTSGMELLLELKQYSQLQNIFYLYNLKTDKIKYLLVPLHNWIEIGIEIASLHLKCMEKSIKKAVCAKKLKGINNFLILCSFLYFMALKDCFSSTLWSFNNTS